jgi:hypothetical protein
MVLILALNLFLTVLLSLTLVLSPIEYAIAKNNTEMVVTLLELTQKINAKTFDRHRTTLSDAIESLPDLSLEVHFTSNSNFSLYIRSFPNTNLYKVRAN